MITKRIAALLLLSCTLLTMSAQTEISRHKPQKAQPQKTTPAKPKPTTPAKPKPTTPAKPTPAPAPAPAEPTASYANGVLTVGSVTYKFVYVAPGTFTMGATSEQENPESDETAHQVTLTNGYYIGQTEVTQALWKAVMGSNPSYFKGDNLPVEQVSWNDCQDFIDRLSDMTGQRFRLPTEAEWEYAARGGNQSRGRQYSGAYSLDNCAWYTDNSGSKTHSVATKQANELGIYDMSGNVWEWCQDWYGSYSSNAVTNPTGPASGSCRVHRGGSWRSDARRCRVALRNGYTPGNRYNNLGLRLVPCLIVPSKKTTDLYTIQTDNPHNMRGAGC